VEQPLLNTLERRKKAALAPSLPAAPRAPAAAPVSWAPAVSAGPETAPPVSSAPGPSPLPGAWPDAASPPADHRAAMDAQEAVWAVDGNGNRGYWAWGGKPPYRPTRSYEYRRQIHLNASISVVPPVILFFHLPNPSIDQRFRTLPRTLHNASTCLT
jgi:hypothetical protein